MRTLPTCPNRVDGFHRRMNKAQCYILTLSGRFIKSTGMLNIPITGKLEKNNLRPLEVVCHTSKSRQISRTGCLTVCESGT